MKQLHRRDGDIDETARACVDVVSVCVEVLKIQS